MKKAEFWKIIKLINWDGDYKRCSETLKELVKNGTIPKLKEFKNFYNSIVKAINTETRRRIAEEQDSFEPYVSYGADDTHFMDLPAELIGRGEEEVNKYLSGKYLVPYEARECFSYMFQG
jgi:hypothetical protein